jgi:TIR domain
MSPQIFISYSSIDRKVAETICAALEARDYPCWISCRDIGAGENFQESIVKAIRSAKVMLLVFTSNANNSNEIKKELVLAGRYHVTVVPLRVEDVVPNDAFAYEFATRQWIDLFKDWEREIGRLTSQIGSILADGTPIQAGDGASAETSNWRVRWPAALKKSPLRPLLLLSIPVVIALGLGGAYLYTRPVVPSSSPAPQASRPSAPQTVQPTADDGAWLDATTADTVQAFRRYLNRFPAGTHVAEAQERIRTADDKSWAEAAGVGTVAALSQYLEQFPDGVHATQARGRMAELESNAADERAWSEAVKAGTIASFNDYLTAFPAGAHRAEAQHRLADLKASAASQPSANTGAGPFDGKWTTIVTCPPAAGAGAFTLLVVADVKDGALRGEKGTQGQPGWFSLDGKVQSNGAVEIVARGIVSSTALAGRNVPVGTEYGYLISGRLEGSKGTGTRKGGRPCSVTFTKQ